MSDQPREPSEPREESTESEGKPTEKGPSRVKQFEARVLELEQLAELLGVAALMGTAATWLVAPATRLVLFLPLVMLAVAGSMIAGIALEKSLRTNRELRGPLTGLGLCVFGLLSMGGYGVWTVAQNYAMRPARVAPAVPIVAAPIVPAPSIPAPAPTKPAVQAGS